MITKEDYKNAKKDFTRLVKARNVATSLIEDTIARYVKSKTRARSKKIASEKDALVNAKKYDCLKMYEKYTDIQEAYGIGMISETEMDKLEALWSERESIWEKVDMTGHYSDEVTTALNEALLSIMDIWDNDIENAKELMKKFENGKY